MKYSAEVDLKLYESTYPYYGGYSPYQTNPIYMGPPIPTRACRYCGNLATWIQTYDRWYCYFCHKYS